MIFLLFFPFTYAQKAVSDVIHPEWSYNLSIYEVNIRQYTEEGTFNAFSEHLPALKELGAGILWFMPVHPIGEKNRKGSLGSYYSVKDYKRINPEFGTLEDFKKLVENAHDNGFYVIIDWVANHTSWDHKWTEEYPEFYNKDDEGNFLPPVPDWSDVIDLNYDNHLLWDHMLDAMKFWVEECDIDGFRCDVAEMVPIEFWNYVRDELEKIKPVFMLAEGENPGLHEHAFDMTYSWTFHHLLNDYADGDKTVTDLVNYFSKDAEEYPENAFRMLFTSNHDENSWNGTVFERLGSAAETFAVLTFLAPGMPLIYSGQESGLGKRLNFFEKDPIEWKDHPFRIVYSKLNFLKRSNSALFNGEKGGKLIILNTSNPEQTMAFLRDNADNKIIAVFNLSDTEQKLSINGDFPPGSYTDYFSGMNYNLNDVLSFKMKPWTYKILLKD
ncbi:MAG: alpha-amylase family glycosyl hydrolase [Ignavibacteriaceae bacterium]